MELHIKDRLIIPGILPAKNTFMGFNLKKSILSKIALTPQDKEDYHINFNSDNITWDVDKDSQVPLIVNFTTEEKEYLVKACEEIAEEEKDDAVWGVIEHIYNN